MKPIETTLNELQTLVSVSGLFQKNRYSKWTKKEVKLYQGQLDEMRRKVMYAAEYTPHKLGYYQFQLIHLLNNAPVSCR